MQEWLEAGNLARIKHSECQHLDTAHYIGFNAEKVNPDALLP